MIASLISIRPRFVDAIFRGEKSVELRRRRLGVTAGHLLFVYETAPVMAIRGIVEVTGVQTEDVADLWSLAAAAASVTRTEYDAYFAGQARASAIHLSRPCTFSTALTLSTIRATSPLFHPPRTWTSYASLPLPLQVQLRALVDNGKEVAFVGGVGARAPRVAACRAGRKRG